ncbi:MAG: alpha/beta hydrolase [Taibaiella sp.]|nr:alpha/beta hydrolase [Taibaiella sp.]
MKTSICTGMITVVLASLNPAKNTCFAQESQPITIGTNYALHSHILHQDRKLNVYIPPGYKENDTTHYPVVYLLDGGMDEDFLHIVGLYQFSSFEWVSRVKPSIIVGIVNVDRKHDFTFPSRQPKEQKNYPTSGGSAPFIDYLQKEVQPWVAQHYRTTAHRTIVGESAGGLLATEILLKRPEMFSRYILVSPSLWWNDGSLMRYPTTRLKECKDRKEIYISSGKEGLAPGNNHVMEVDANVMAERIRALNNHNLHLVHDYLPDEDHATTGHRAVLNALKSLSR